MWDSNKKKGDLNMKTLVNKTILAVVATVLVAGTVFFASCEKENKAKIDSMETKSINAAEIPEVIPVGTMQNGYFQSIPVIIATIFIINHNYLLF